MSQSRVAGFSAFAAGLAWVTWVALNSRTHGGLDAGPSIVGERLGRLGALLMVSSNVLLIPAALELDASLREELGPSASRHIRLATAAGIISLLFWSLGAAMRTITPALEVSYIALSSVWWTTLGFALLPRHRTFGSFTILLGAFALWDALLTAFEPVPFGLYVTAAPKLPLSIVWDFWLAAVLLRPLSVAKPALVGGLMIGDADGPPPT